MDFGKIKSWRIVLAGTFIQFLLSVREVVTSGYLCTDFDIGTLCQSLSNYSTSEVIAGIFSLFPFTWLIFVALLYFDKARKWTGVIIVFGVMLAFYSEGILLVIFLVFAGIFPSKNYTFSDIKQIIPNMKRDGIKSWHIILGGFFLQVMIGLFLIFTYASCKGGCDMSPLIALIAFLSFSSAGILLIPLNLLRKDTTKKTGAIVSIFLFVIPIIVAVLLSNLYQNIYGYIDAVRITIAFLSPGLIFALITGIYYFRKKV